MLALSFSTFFSISNACAQEEDSRATLFRELVSSLQSDIIKIMDSRSGPGTAQISFRSRQFAEALSKAQEIAADSDLSIDALSELLGEVEIPVFHYETAIAAANKRLNESGLNFIKIVQSPEAGAFTESLSQGSLPNSREPLPGQQNAYSKWRNWRIRSLPVLSSLATYVGSGQTGPGLFQAASVFLVDRQFIKYSNRWKMFWNRFGIAGNLAVNSMIPIISASILVATERALIYPPSLNLAEFVVKSFLINTAAMTASLGAIQVISSRMDARGELSEFTRFRLETIPSVIVFIGRALALGAISTNVFHSLASFDSIRISKGELIGWGLQAAVAVGLALPLYLRVQFGDSLYHDRSNRQLPRRTPLEASKESAISSFCKKAMRGLVPLLSFRRL